LGRVSYRWVRGEGGRWMAGCFLGLGFDDLSVYSQAGACGSSAQLETRKSPQLYTNPLPFSAIPKQDDLQTLSQVDRYDLHHLTSYVQIAPSGKATLGEHTPLSPIVKN
jgi:hypothetical protein